MVLISLVPALTPLYLYVSTFRSMCAVHSMAVFCSSLTSWFPGMLLTYFLNNFEKVPVALLLLLLLLLLLSSSSSLLFLFQSHCIPFPTPCIILFICLFCLFFNSLYYLMFSRCYPPTMYFSLSCYFEFYPLSYLFCNIHFIVNFMFCHWILLSYRYFY